MDLNRVAVFVKVVEEGGVTAAARALGVPKSSVSRSVALLEHEVGAQLLRRSTRKVSPTEAGAAFFERASRAVATLEEAREAALDLEGTVRGTIRVTTAEDMGTWMLAPIIAAFVARYPEAHVEAVLTSRVVDFVEESIDLALRAGNVRDEALIARRLPDTELALYASPSYLRKHGRPKRVADLERHRFVVFRAARGRGSWTLIGPSGEERVEVKSAVSADDFSFVREAIASGAGIGLLPTFHAESARAPLERVLRSHTAPGAPVHLVYPSGRQMPYRVMVFRDFVMERLRAAPRPKRP